MYIHGFIFVSYAVASADFIYAGIILLSLSLSVKILRTIVRNAGYYFTRNKFLVRLFFAIFTDDSLKFR